MASGIVRRIDELGRIVIPKEMRKTMRLQVGDEMEITSSGDTLTLRRYSGFQSVLSEAKSVARELGKAVDADVLLQAQTPWRLPKERIKRRTKTRALPTLLRTRAREKDGYSSR